MHADKMSFLAVANSEKVVSTNGTHVGIVHRGLDGGRVGSGKGCYSLHHKPSFEPHGTPPLIYFCVTDLQHNALSNPSLYGECDTLHIQIFSAS